jgi:hypothetical protein
LEYTHLNIKVKIKGFNVKPSFEEFKEKFYRKGDIITENIE